MKDQLRDMTIVIAEVNKVDGVTYASSRVYKFDLQWDPAEFIKAIEKLTPKGKKTPYIVEGGVLKCK